MHKGIHLLLAIAAEGLKFYYKIDDTKISEILGVAPRLPASRKRAVLTAFGFPVKIGEMEVPFYVCLAYTASGLILGKNPDELALMLGEDRGRAVEMMREGLKWSAKLAYMIVRLAQYAKDEDVRKLGVGLIGESIWDALAIYSASNLNMSVYGLYKNLSRNLYQFPSESDAEELKKEIEALMNGGRIEKVISGEPSLQPVVPANSNSKTPALHAPSINVDRVKTSLKILQKELDKLSRDAHELRVLARKIVEK